MTLETRTFTITRADLVAYAEAAGDPNPIHQDEQVALSVGLPGVIAHGMLTLALAARAVAGWVPGAEVVLHWNPAHTFGLDAAQDIDAGVAEVEEDAA